MYGYSVVITLTNKTSYRIGVVSDTHGTVPDTLVKAFANVDLIVHAGDIGKPLVVNYLKRIAPIVAVRGNVDHGLWAFEHPEHAIIQAGNTKIYVVHNLADLDCDSQDKYQCVIYGHTHKACCDKRGNVFFVNPGSASICHSPSAALLSIDNDSIDVNFISI